MNYHYWQEYEATRIELREATIAVGGYTVQIAEISESAFVRWQAALQGFTSAQRKFYERPIMSISDILTPAKV